MPYPHTISAPKTQSFLDDEGMREHSQFAGSQRRLMSTSLFSHPLVAPLSWENRARLPRLAHSSLALDSGSDCLVFLSQAAAARGN